MTMSLRGLGIVTALVLAVACGSTSGSENNANTTGTTGGSQSAGAQSSQNNQAVEEGMVVANALRDDYVQLKSTHESAWQQRIAIATGPDLNTIGPRYATASADFNARADQAWQAMNSAVGHLHQNRVDQFRQLINESRSHVAVMRQMVELVQAELLELSNAAPPAPESGSEPQEAVAPEAQ